MLGIVSPFVTIIHITLSLNYFQGRTENELFELEMLAIRVFYTAGNWLLLNASTVFKQN
jgi:hypothetical protein